VVVLEQILVLDDIKPSVALRRLHCLDFCIKRICFPDFEISQKHIMTLRRPEEYIAERLLHKALHRVRMSLLAVIRVPDITLSLHPVSLLFDLVLISANNAKLFLGPILTFKRHKVK